MKTIQTIKTQMAALLAAAGVATMAGCASGPGGPVPAPCAAAG